MRREFSRKLRAEIILRATNAAGHIVCEGCGLILGKKPFQIDHTLPEALVMDKSRPVTAADGKLLGQECCHGPKTRNDVRMIRKADRQRDRSTGAIGRSGSFAPAQRNGRASKPLTKQLPPRRFQ